MVKFIKVNLRTESGQIFEQMRIWRVNHGEEITKEDVAWYNEALEQEKKDNEKFLDDNPTIREMLNAVAQGKTDEERDEAEKKVRKALPEELGPMPSYGSSEFWAWCRRRKEIRLEKEAAIIAAGGTIEVKKTKKKT